MKDDGARGAEITVEDGSLPYCPDCQTKHSADLLAHIDPKDTEKHAKAEWIFKRNLHEVGMTELQGKDYQTIRELEHKIEDGLTVLRDLRHKVQASPGIDNPVNPHNPGGPVYDRCVKKVMQHCCGGERRDVSKCTCNPYAVCHATVKA